MSSLKIEALRAAARVFEGKAITVQGLYDREIVASTIKVAEEFYAWLCEQ